MNHSIWTIGHSTHSLEKFVSLLKLFQIEVLVDIRSLPGSRKFPQFNKESLVVSLLEQGIEYIHMIDLGGRRKMKPDSKNTAWRLPAFRAYADYMETENFRNAASQLESIAKSKATAYMCSETLWWRCHRSLVSDWFKIRGWTVLHITGDGKTVEHPYTGPARIVDGEIRYIEENNYPTP